MYMFTLQHTHTCRAMTLRRLLSGTVPALGDNESRVPVLTIHVTPDVRCPTLMTSAPSYGDGWDLVVPGAWGMPFLLGLVYRGARVGGLRELRHSDFEMSQQLFPGGCPDTEAGRVHEEGVRTELETAHNKRPPAKRPSYVKMGTPWPFVNPWQTLLCDWCAADDDAPAHEQWAVLRNRATLERLDDFVRRGTSLADVEHGGALLVPVTLTMVRRGCCESFSSICLPSSQDLAQLAADAQYTGPTERLHTGPTKRLHTGPTERLHTGPTERLHTGLTERLHTHKDRNNSNNAAADCDQTVKNHCDRVIVGFVSEGSFSFRIGQGKGLGFVAFNALRELVSKSSRMPGGVLVLVRPRQSLQYRFALLSIA